MATTSDDQTTTPPSGNKKLYTKAWLEHNKPNITPIENATLSVASSAVLYGLSVYTVFPICMSDENNIIAFRLDEHYRRLNESCAVLGIDKWKMTYSAFEKAVREIVAANKADITADAFIRTTVHLTDLVPGARTRGITASLSMFIYRAAQIVPRDGARLKTTYWRRIPDYCIPARAKVNGAYVNSALAKQDALDAGFDDAVLLDSDGHVCESSVANIFIIRRGSLITSPCHADILEGINRRTILEFAVSLGIPTEERCIDLTELYIADEVFMCGTSAYVCPVKEIDGRVIGDGSPGELTLKLLDIYTKTLHGSHDLSKKFATVVS